MDRVSRTLTRAASRMPTMIAAARPTVESSAALVYVPSGTATVYVQGFVRRRAATARCSSEPTLRVEHELLGRLLPEAPVRGELLRDIGVDRGDRFVDERLRLIAMTFGL